MKQALFLILGLALTGCATTAPRLTIDGRLPGWMQVISIPPADGPAGVAPLLLLRHQTGAEISVDAYDLGGKTVTQMAELVQEKLREANVNCEPIRNDSRPSCGDHTVGSTLFDARVASFRTVLFDESGRLWRGKVSVLKLRGAPADTVFVFAGRWLNDDDTQAILNFDEIVKKASVK